MAKYIDAEKLANKIVYTLEKYDETSGSHTYSCFKTFLDIIAIEPPAIDVVEAVRCEKCKHGDVSIFSKTVDGKEKIACYCNLQKAVMDVNWYCPNGERKTDNAEEPCKTFKNKTDYAEVKHARWKGAGMGDYECTNCWEVFSGGNKFKHCPNCGAVMDAISLSESLTGSERSDT